MALRQAYYMVQWNDTARLPRPLADEDYSELFTAWQHITPVFANQGVDVGPLCVVELWAQQATLNALYGEAWSLLLDPGGLWYSGIMTDAEYFTYMSGRISQVWDDVPAARKAAVQAWLADNPTPTKLELVRDAFFGLLIVQDWNAAKANRLVVEVA